MKSKVIIIALTVTIATLLLFSFPKKQAQIEWNTFNDSFNGWEIKYPPDITNIGISENRDRKICEIMTISFGKKPERGVWVFTVTVSETKYSTIDDFIRESPDDMTVETYTTVDGARGVIQTTIERYGERYISFLRNDRLFTIHTNSLIDHETLLKSFKFFESFDHLSKMGCSED